MDVLQCVQCISEVVTQYAATLVSSIVTYTLANI